MNPQQALNILTQATEEVTATRKQHMLISQALDVLKQLIDTYEEEA